MEEFVDDVKGFRSNIVEHGFLGIETQWRWGTHSQNQFAGLLSENSKTQKFHSQSVINPTSSLDSGKTFEL